MKMRRGTATSVGRYGAKSFQHGMAPGPEARRVRLRCRLVAWGPTVRGMYSTPVAGARSQYVHYVGPRRHAALRLRCVPKNAGGWYA